jgi:glucan phosphoethanolaminetransferase (alkaline phosphatase superfamily)
MIQRIQSIYLLIAALLTGLMIFLPLAQFSAANGMISLGAFSTTSAIPGFVPQNTIVLAILSGLSALLSLVTIFMYKKRTSQSMMISVNMFLEIILLAAILFYVFSVAGKLGAEYKFLYPTVFPLVSWIFLFLALRGVKKDENLVRSLDRIR